MSDVAIASYLTQVPKHEQDTGALAYIASLAEISKVLPEVAAAVVQELADQRASLKLIASENYCSLPTQLAMGNLLTDKYAEGYPGHRFYAGCENVDTVEARACAEACRLFGAEHAYVQAHSGADANMIAYWAILSTRVEMPLLAELGEHDPSKLDRRAWNGIRRKLAKQRLLGLDYYSGGHLTHGYRHNASAQMFDAYSYSVSKRTGLLDYDQLERRALQVKPLILLAGYSAYPRKIDFRRMREIADKVGAVLMVDMAHFAGLVAGGVFEDPYNPVPYAQMLTATTHKTLRGPRGGLVLCNEEFSEAVDKGCPMVIGGPLPHVMAAKAIALAEANEPEFGIYARKVVSNCQTLAETCLQHGMQVITGGTDNHLLLIDVRGFGLTGRQAESALRDCGVTLNRNSLPFDPNGPWYTSGLRIGTPAVTTLGMGPEEMQEIAAVLQIVLSATSPVLIESGAHKGRPSRAKYRIAEAARDEAGRRVEQLLQRFPVYPQLDLEFLKKQFLR